MDGRIPALIEGSSRVERRVDLVLEPCLEVMLPVHIEGETIETTIREIYDELSPQIALRFIVTEDGSTDDTKDVLRRLSEPYPMRLILSDRRKGYKDAVIDAMREVRAPYVLCLDADGQCDPRDFWRFWESRGGTQVLVGRRVRVRRSLRGRLLSGLFYAAYKVVLRVPVHDPSFCYVLARREVIERIGPEMREMSEGFWWEFAARAHRGSFSIGELPVSHRDRLAGKSRIWKISKLPDIAYRQIVGLFKVWYQTRS